jgi:hypothetical protein
MIGTFHSPSVAFWVIVKSVILLTDKLRLGVVKFKIFNLSSHLALSILLLIANFLKNKNFTGYGKII